MKVNPEKQLDLRAYRTFGLPLLLLMGIFAVVGVVTAIVISHFF